MSNFTVGLEVRRYYVAVKEMDMPEPDEIQEKIDKKEEELEHLKKAKEETESAEESEREAESAGGIL